jgi:hypothetical protein
MVVCGSRGPIYGSKERGCIRQCTVYVRRSFDTILDTYLILTSLYTKQLYDTFLFTSQITALGLQYSPSVAYTIDRCKTYVMLLVSFHNPPNNKAVYLHQ